MCSHLWIQRPRTCKHFPEMPFLHIALAPPTFLGSTAASSLVVQWCVSHSSLKEFTLFQVWAVANIPIMSLGDLVYWLLLLWVWPRGVLGHRKSQYQPQRTQLTEVNLLPPHPPGARAPFIPTWDHSQSYSSVTVERTTSPSLCHGHVVFVKCLFTYVGSFKPENIFPDGLP